MGEIGWSGDPVIWWSEKPRTAYRGSTRMTADQNKSKPHHGLTRMGRIGNRLIWWSGDLVIWW